MSDAFYKDPTNPTIPTEPHQENPSLIPEMIGSYKIEGLFEKGGMSILYLGENVTSHEPAIIKVLSKKYLMNKEVVDRFLKEADIIAMTDHPNIVKIYGHGSFEGGLYMAIEFVQGMSLRQYILQKHISLKRAIEMVIEIAYALCHLHMHGVIHRDLKPDNILVTETNSTKMIDFGIAQLLTESETISETNQGRVIGTPVYMSPEQKQNPGSVSYPSDIYSLAIIAYELILGKLSYGQIHISLMPKGLRHILHKSLQLDPNLRYQDVVDFIADLSAFLNSPAINDEQSIKDDLSDILENLKNTQLILVTEKAPAWPEFDIGIATNKDTSLLGLRQGLYQDFFELAQNNYGVLMSESSLKNKETIIYTAATRGMIRALCKLTNAPSELVTILNDLIINDPLRHSLSLSYMTINLDENTLKYIACGEGQVCFFKLKNKPVERIINQNFVLGVEPYPTFKSIEKSFTSEDTICLFSFSGLKIRSTENQELLLLHLTKTLTENIHLPAEQLAQIILKRLKIIFSKIIYDTLFSAIIVKKK